MNVWLIGSVHMALQLKKKQSLQSLIEHNMRKHFLLPWQFILFIFLMEFFFAMANLAAFHFSPRQFLLNLLPWQIVKTCCHANLHVLCKIMVNLVL